MPKRRFVFVIIALVATACAPEFVPAATTAATTTIAPTTTTTTLPPPTTTTTLPPPTTTTLPPVPVFDTINGLERPTEEPLGVIAIKIDNHPKARPATGLQYADIVYELPVEAGVTRLIAMYDRNQVEKVGPVRSLRPTDTAIVNPIDVPLQVSGGSNWVLRKVRASGTKLLTDNGHGTSRDKSRYAPHNLYADTEIVRDYVEELWGNVSPGNLFVYGEADELGGSATHITIPFSAQPPSVWDWDAETERYLHFYADEPHITYGVDEGDDTEIEVVEDGDAGTAVDEEGDAGTTVDEGSDTGIVENGTEEVAYVGQQVVADTLIVILADRYTARPDRPSDGKAVPAMRLIGTGEAFVFHDGGIGRITWVREKEEDPITLFNADESPVTMHPGIIWVSIVPSSETVAWE